MVYSQKTIAIGYLNHHFSHPNAYTTESNPYGRMQRYNIWYLSILF